MSVEIRSVPDATAYPSRLDAPRLIHRSEPVLYGGCDSVGPFSREELGDFERDGFVVVRDLFAPDEMKAVLEAFRVATESMPATDSRIIREPDSKAIRSLFAFHGLPGLLSRFARDERLVARAMQILGSSVYVHQSRINQKPAFDGRDFEWHSDFETWHSEDGMPSMRAVSVSVALTRNEAFNGPLMFIPGSHRVFVSCVGRTPADHHLTSLRRQEYGVPDRQTLTSLVALQGIEVFRGEPGTVAFFDCNLLHGSPSNISPVPRSNAFTVYNSVSNRLGAPFGGSSPRPEHIAARMRDDVCVPASGRLVPGS